MERNNRARKLTISSEKGLVDGCPSPERSLKKHEVPKVRF